MEQILFTYAFDFVWLCQEVDNTDFFIPFLKQRLYDNIQWSADINISPSCYYYKQYKSFETKTFKRTLFIETRQYTIQIFDKTIFLKYRTRQIKYTETNK